MAAVVVVLEAARSGARDEVVVTTGDDAVVAARGSGDVVLQAASGAMGDGVKSRGGTGVREESERRAVASGGAAGAAQARRRLAPALTTGGVGLGEAPAGDWWSEAAAMAFRRRSGGAGQPGDGGAASGPGVRLGGNGIGAAMRWGAPDPDRAGGEGEWGSWGMGVRVSGVRPYRPGG
nr:spidroin-1-like [Aegilops tauschii subsp. strangulata]